MKLTDEERGLLAERFVSWFGDERQAFLVTQISSAVERIVTARTAECRREVVEMSRRASIAETERDAALAEVERLLEVTA